jgi:hypothetical protein
VDEFRYDILGGYDTVKRGAVGAFNTTHRMTFLGLRPGLYGEDRVTSYTAGTDNRAYNESRILGASLSRPFPWFYSSVTPTLFAEWGRITYDGDFGKQVFTPELRYGGDIVWDTRQQVLYSVAPEWGFRSRLAGKRYQPMTTFHDGALKYLASWNQLLPALPRHSSVSVTGYYAAVAGPKESMPSSYVQPGYSGSNGDLNPPLRGYTSSFIKAKQVVVGQLEYRLPLGQMFRGNDTFPFFMRNLGAYVFGDAARVRQGHDETAQPLIASAGGGLLFNTQLFYLAPLNLRIEVAHGFSKSNGGENQFYLGAEL